MLGEGQIKFQLMFGYGGGVSIKLRIKFKSKMRWLHSGRLKSGENVEVLNYLECYLIYS